MTRLLIALLLPALTAVLYACAHTPSLPAWHPMEVSAGQMCSDCHTDWRAALNHTPDFAAGRHKSYAAQQQQVCDFCHVQSFCMDCHANKEELKPSQKYQDAPERTMPHRGDYLTQHKIDGKINPASCIPCHGRLNNQRCKVCHK